jgi:nitroreductase
MNDKLLATIGTRFGEAVPAQDGEDWSPAWHQMAARGSCRAFRDEPLSGGTLEMLAALALCAPSKSDLQQRDIIVIEDKGLRGKLNALLTEGPLGQAWIAGAPHLLVFCANNRRQRLLQAWRQKTFANDHLDAFFNAALDAGIAMAQFVNAAEAAGLGCCPISAIRNRADAVSRLLRLPDHVFPVVALAVGRPREAPKISFRLPLSVTLHKDGYEEAGLRGAIEAYDARREAAQPIRRQRYAEDFGTASPYGWSEDKARQYAKPERETFGGFIRSKGFKLD